MKHFYTTLISVCLASMLGVSLFAAEYHVDQDGTGDFTLIQEAIDAAVDGDTIIVHPGTYCENIEFTGPNISLRSVDPDDPEVVDSTVIDGGWSGSVVTFTGDEDESCVLSGFTITNGNGHAGGGICGGDSILSRTKATITNCKISRNFAYYGGALAYCEGVIANCVIVGRREPFMRRPDSGGGLYKCDGTIRDCVIKDNDADSGAGLFDCDGTIIRCVISDNYSQGGGGGGLYRCDAIIDNCVVAGNYAISNIYSGSGGGLHSCNATILNCTIYGNTADFDGGGLYECEGEISNCIIWGNSAESGNELHESSAPSFSCISGWTDGGEGNTSEDPVLAAPEDGDFRLSLGSPCIDSGNNWAVWGNQDLDGGPRIIDRTVDMGAYEYRQGCWIVVESDAEMYWGQSTMVLSLEAGDFGSPQTVDLYAALQFPDERLLFIPSLSGDWSPWVLGLQLASGDVFSPPEPFSYAFSASDPDGVYSVYSALFGHGSTEPADLLTNIASSSFGRYMEVPTEFHAAKDGTGHFATVQGAMDAAEEGNTIIVHPGVYYENISFNGKNVTLQSTDPADPQIVESTIIEGRGHVVTFAGSEDESCLLWGVTIANGDGNGIYGAGCRASIANCIVRDNSRGGIVNCDGAITDCTISDNYAEEGGGLSECNGDIIRCKITGNRATWRSGGGLAWCNGRIIDCTIADNQTTRWPEHTPFGGGGIYACDGLFQDCLIYDNYTECYGGGVWSSNGTFANCIFWGNEAGYSYGGICGFNTPSPCYPKIVNCTFVNNDGAICDCFGPIRNCIIWNNPRGDTGVSDAPDINYCCISNWNWQHGGVGNISDDPMFVPGPFGEYYLDPESPCIDAGSQSAEEAGLSDRTTQADGTPDAGTVDMGYHYPILEAEVDVEVSCSLNADEFAPGDSMQGYLAVQNEGVEATVDVFVGFVLPDGSIYSWSDTGIALGVWPWMGDVTLPEGFSFGPEAILEFVVPGNLQRGVYSYVAAIAPSASPYDFICIDSAQFNVI